MHRVYPARRIATSLARLDDLLDVAVSTAQAAADFVYAKHEGEHAELYARLREAVEAFEQVVTDQSPD